MVDIEMEILERIIKIENALSQGLNEVKETLNLGRDSFQFFTDGLNGYRERRIKEVEASKTQVLVGSYLEKFRKDKELSFSHRKILKFLVEQYDFQKKVFKEVHFSKLVKEAHVGKNVAKGFLELLEAKGYIQRRHDGYKTFFKIMG